VWGSLVCTFVRTVGLAVERLDVGGLDAYLDQHLQL